MLDTTTLYKEIITYLEENFSGSDYFCCVYGSYPSSRATSGSDVDLFVASESISDPLFKKLEKFILKLHEKHNLAQDEEVPYSNKLLVSYKDVGLAVTLEQFKSNRKEEYVIPEVQKTPEFLSSEHIRLRLIFNAFTTPHEYISGNFLTYLKARNEAEKNLYKLATYICDKAHCSLDELVHGLIRNESHAEGEMYLGYKDFDSIKGYLLFLLSKEYEK